MSYDLNKWVDNERRSLPRNRYLVYALAVMIVATAALALLEVFERDDRGRVANLGLPLILLTLAMINSPFARDGWLGVRGARYDEFEQSVLARATARAFAVMLALILALFVWLWLASVNNWPMPRTPVDWSALGLAFLGIGGALPVKMAELVVPVPPAGDGDHD